MKTALVVVAILAGSLAIAASILFVGRWQIAAAAYGYSQSPASEDQDYEAVYRLNRWTGEVDYCDKVIAADRSSKIQCPAAAPLSPTVSRPTE